MHSTTLNDMAEEQRTGGREQDATWHPHPQPHPRGTAKAIREHVEDVHDPVVDPE